MNSFWQDNWQIIGLVLSVLNLGLICYLFWAIRRINKLKAVFFAGKNGLDLEAVLENLSIKLQSMDSEQAAVQHELSELKKQFGFAVQKIGLVRFNPFNDSGGDFSFCLALLDAANSGVVLTSMHGRQQHRIYTKTISNGKSENTLTEEEQQAINQANTKPHPSPRRK